MGVNWILTTMATISFIMFLIYQQIMSVVLLLYNKYKVLRLNYQYWYVKILFFVTTLFSY